MNERDIALDKVHKAIAENVRQFKAWSLNATMCEVNIKTYQSQMEQLAKEYKDKDNKFRLQIDRAVENAKISHEMLDELIKEKEALHIELKQASHYGMVQCEHCKQFFTSQGLSRHQNNCSMKENVKAIEEHQAEIVDDKEDVESKKAALLRELEKLGVKK